MSPSVVPLSPSASCCSCYVADGHQNPELLLLGKLLLRELACFLGASISSLSRIALILALSRVLPPERKPRFSSKLFPPPGPNDATPEDCCMLPWLHPPPCLSAEKSTFPFIGSMRQARTPHRWRSRGQELPLLHGFPVMSLSSFRGSFSLQGGADLCGAEVGPSDEEPRVSGGAAAGPCGRSVGPCIYGEKLADERSVSLSSMIRGYIQEGKVKEGEGEA